MQVTLYFGEEDEYLIRLVDDKARRERKSRSAVVLSILEHYFEQGKRLGEILVDLKMLTPHQIEQALEIQREEGHTRPIGQILVEKGWVDDVIVEKALRIQERVNHN
jgi:hypothetical protein